jgi:hypothetical protein
VEHIPYRALLPAVPAVARAGPRRSWAEFGAALVLGRLLWTADLGDADLDRYGVAMAHSVEPFTILTTEPTSPWRTVPLRPPVPAESSPAVP